MLSYLTFKFIKNVDNQTRKLARVKNEIWPSGNDFSLKSPENTFKLGLDKRNIIWLSAYLLQCSNTEVSSILQKNAGMCSIAQLCLTLWDPMDCSLSVSMSYQSSSPWDSPGKNIGVTCHFLLQGILPSQGSNPHLLCWQVDSLPLCFQGSSTDE